jgi:hypothetical protein
VERVGVTYRPENGPERLFQAKYATKTLGYYPTEEMAAHKYNLAKLEVSSAASLNDVKEPEGFLEFDTKWQANNVKQNEYPIIKNKYGGFQICGMKRNKQVIATGTYKTYREAWSVCDAALVKPVPTRREELDIRRNAQGVAVLIATKNAKNGEYADVMVDDDVYVFLKVNDDGKETGLTMNTKRGGPVYLNTSKQQLSDFVMRRNVSEEVMAEAKSKGWIIHHKGEDNKDNRGKSLCFAPRTTNSQSTGPHVNKKRKNTVDTIGYHIDGYGNISAQIRENGKKVHLGIFDSIEEAGAAYDKAALRGQLVDRASTKKK